MQDDCLVLEYLPCGTEREGGMLLEAGLTSGESRPGDTNGKELMGRSLPQDRAADQDMI